MISLFFPENMIITRIISQSIIYKKSKKIHVRARHIHTLSFRISGEKLFLPDGCEKPLFSGSGSITYIPHGTAYDEETPEGGQMFAIHFELAEEHAAEAFVFHPASPIAYQNLFEGLVSSYRVGNEREYHSMALLYELFAMLRHEALRTERYATPRRIRAALEHINNDFINPELSVSALAAEAGISEVYFRREFRSCIGMSPIEYIRRVRLENAKALLGTAMYPVSEVAIRCGFDSISYFSSQFKRSYGTSPSQYIKNKSE